MYVYRATPIAGTPPIPSRSRFAHVLLIVLVVWTRGYILMEVHERLDIPIGVGEGDKSLGTNQV